MTRDQKILRFLQYPSITYKRIGKRFGITRERVRQIRGEFITNGETVPNRSKNIHQDQLIAAILKRGVPYKQICAVLNISKADLLSSKRRSTYRGIRFPRTKISAPSRDAILRMLKEDTGPYYGRATRIAKIRGVSRQHILNTRCVARKGGIL